MGSFSPQELAVLHARTAVLQKEYGARFGFLPDEKTKEEYMRKGEQLMKGLTSVKITVWPEIRKGFIGLVDRLSPKTRKNINFYDLLQFTNVFDDNSDEIGSIHMHVYDNQPYTKDLRAVLLDFRNSDPDGFDALIRHMACTNAYIGACHTLADIVHEQSNFEEYLKTLKMSEQEIAAKELIINDI